MLRVGQPAPDFILPGASGQNTSLTSLRGQKVVLYFYPKDDTPGCTMEACDFRDNMARLSHAGATVIGVSKDSIASHLRFREKYGLPYELLSDPDNRVASAYGAYGTKMMYGRPVVGTIRSTFLIDEQGRIAAVWSPVRVKGHVDAVMAELKGVTPEVAAARDTAAAKAAATGKPKATKKAAPKKQKPKTKKKPAKKKATKKAGKKKATKKAGKKKATKKAAKRKVPRKKR